MRVYLPATLTLVRDLLATGVLPAPVEAFAVTPELREWYVDDDSETLEFAALTEAARASLLLLAADPAAPRRRLVLAADVAGQNLFGRHEMPAGVITGALGAPFLLWMLVRSKTSGSGR